jgi:protein-disulfide isomerase
VRRSAAAALAIAAVACAAAAIVGAVPAAASSTSPGTALLAGIPQKGTVLGRADARLTLLVYEDLGCPHCRSLMTDAFPTVVREFVRPGRVKVDFRGLGVVAPASGPALLYALAAGRQNRLWHVVELFYENQDRLDRLVNDAAVRRLTRDVRGLDGKRVVRDARSASVRRQANAVLAEAQRRGVPGTPWLFVQRRGEQPVPVQVAAFTPEVFRAMLKAALRR